MPESRSDTPSVLQAHQVLLDYALSLPGTHEDFPWGERVVKVKNKVFIFLGKNQPEGELGFSVKLPASAAEVLKRPGTAPTGYGLGKSGWVSITLTDATCPSEEQLRAWLTESYTAVAPKRLSKGIAAEFGGN